MIFRISIFVNQFSQVMNYEIKKNEKWCLYSLFTIVSKRKIHVHLLCIFGIYSLALLLSLLSVWCVCVCVYLCMSAYVCERLLYGDYDLNAFTRAYLPICSMSYGTISPELIDFFSISFLRHRYCCCCCLFPLNYGRNKREENI